MTAAERARAAAHAAWKLDELGSVNTDDDTDTDPIPRRKPTTKSRTKPKIKISTQQDEVVDQAEQALRGVGGVYVRSRRLVHVVRDHGGMDWLKRAEGEPTIAVVRPNRLREMIGAAAEWFKFDGRSEKWKPSMVPDWVAPTLAERDQWAFPVLDGVSDAPVLRVDGSIHDVPGYDAVTRMIYAPGSVRWPTIKASPTHADAVAAMVELGEPFCNFPFLAPSDLTATIALTLTLIGRCAIPGPTPMFVPGSTVAGTGKGLVSDAAGLIATGRETAKTPPTQDDAEMRKRLLAIALSGVPLVVIDNVDGFLGTPSLDSALTADVISDRGLGGNEMHAAGWRAVLVATGNNIQYRGDLGRRVVPIDMDPQMENPEDRHGFRHPDLLGYVRANRPRLVVAALTILRAYCLAGKPSHGNPAKGSYNAWDGLVRGAIIWAGGADPLGGVARVRASGDADKDDLRALLVAWFEALGSRDVTATDLIEAGRRYAPLEVALNAYRIKDEALTAKRLGDQLARRRGRIIGMLSIEHAATHAHGGARQWCVTRGVTR
ncbi:MAG: hypothetical protein NT062_31935 [Proteobacteria bacterium]|nr:hypothetical protein [Pseudomonadota bacterium]